jgi:S-(hydroxymethyl)glutathione dehydrogenase / alcohol dehydrogenase
MIAALMTAVGESLRICEVETLPLQYGQVRVKLIASGICGAQLQELRGEKTAALPRLLGHEGVGEVLEVGAHVSTVKRGDKVILHWRKGAGIESDFPRYRVNGTEFTSGKVVTFASEVVVSENRCTAVPADTNDKLCALLGCGLSTAIGTIEYEANLLIGQTVLIIGCGGLGMNLIFAARLRRASTIAVVDVVGEKKHLAQMLGATHFGKELHDITERFDVVIDTTGSTVAQEQGLQLVADSGKFIMVGQPNADVRIIGARHLFGGEGKTIKATQGGGFRPHLDIPRYVSLSKSGDLNPVGIVSHRFRLEEINDAIELVKRGEAGRVLIYP